MAELQQNFILPLQPLFVHSHANMVNVFLVCAVPNKCEGPSKFYNKTHISFVAQFAVSKVSAKETRLL